MQSMLSSESISGKAPHQLMIQGGACFKSFCNGRISDQSLACTRFIRDLYESKETAFVVGTAMQVPHHKCQYWLSIGEHPLVPTANKVFWQLKPPFPRYHGTYDATIVLRYIESLGQNADLTLKQLSEKAVFLVAFATLSRYCGL